MAGRRIEDTGAIMSFAVDTVEEVGMLPTTTTTGTGNFAEAMNYTAPLGSECIVGNNGGDLKVYTLFGFGWKALN